MIHVTPSSGVKSSIGSPVPRGDSNPTAQLCLWRRDSAAVWSAMMAQQQAMYQMQMQLHLAQSGRTNCPPCPISTGAMDGVTLQLLTLLLQQRNTQPITIPAPTPIPAANVAGVGPQANPVVPAPAISIHLSSPVPQIPTNPPYQVLPPQGTQYQVLRVPGTPYQVLTVPGTPYQALPSNPPQTPLQQLPAIPPKSQQVLPPMPPATPPAKVADESFERTTSRVKLSFAVRKK